METSAKLATRVIADCDIQFGNADLQAKRGVLCDGFFDIVKRDSSRTPVALNPDCVNGRSIIDQSLDPMLPPLNRPIWEKVPRFASVINLVSMPPIESPAMARFG